MFNSSLFKITTASLTAIAVIVSINFVTNTLMAAENLKKDAVSITSEVKQEAVETTADKIAEIKDEVAEDTTDIKTAKEEEAAQIPKSIIDLIASVDASKGAKISKSCAACHTFNKGGKKKIGPNLWNIVGQEKASVDGFSYSKGMKAVGGTWDYDSLDKFLAKPKSFVKGTKMSFVGVKKIEDRAALIAWLREQADTPIDLPASK